MIFDLGNALVYPFIHGFDFDRRTNALRILWGAVVTVLWKGLFGTYVGAGFIVAVYGVLTAALTLGYLNTRGVDPRLGVTAAVVAFCLVYGTPLAIIGWALVPTLAIGFAVYALFLWIAASTGRLQ